MYTRELRFRVYPNLTTKVDRWLVSAGVGDQKTELPKGVSVVKSEVVFNPSRYRMFLGALESVEKRSAQPAFQPKLGTEADAGDRENTLKHLDALCKQVSHNRQCRVLRAWHGTSEKVLQSILEDGFAAIATLDGVLLPACGSLFTPCCGRWLVREGHLLQHLRSLRAALLQEPQGPSPLLHRSAESVPAGAIGRCCRMRALSVPLLWQSELQ